MCFSPERSKWAWFYPKVGVASKFCACFARNSKIRALLQDVLYPPLQLGVSSQNFGHNFLCVLTSKGPGYLLCAAISEDPLVFTSIVVFSNINSCMQYL